MDAKIFRVNYKSDFILTLTSDAGWMTPFCIKFWTGAPSQAFYASWDGETYTHCSYDPEEPTKLTVQFDDHHLPTGELKYQIAYHFTVDDFPNDTEDEVLNQANVITILDGEEYHVMLDFSGETAPEIQFSLPAYANELQRIENEQQRIENEQQRIENETRRENVAEEDHRVAVADHEQAESDHTRANNDHTRAESDHTTASNDHTRAESDHTTASNDHTRAGEDHTRAESDHTTASNDHTQAGTDHTRAESDHTTASNDHTRAESDHTRAESDHAAIEPFMDSLGAFDISAYHAEGGVLAKYANLSAALGTNGANIPEAIRKGGMSIKFVLTSDNKYVQYRLLADEWSVDTDDWAICDDSVLVECSEYVTVYLDADKKIIKAVRNDGTVYLAAGLEVHGDISTDASDVTMIESPEFFTVWMDKDDKILFGIQNNGNFYFGCGVPQQIIDYINEKLAELSLDEYEDIVTFLNGLETGDKTLAELLNEKVDKVEGKSLIDKDVADGVSYAENSEFINVELDADNKIIKGTKNDGTEYFGVGIDIAGVAAESAIENNEFISVDLDGDGKILEGRREDGTKDIRTDVEVEGKTGLNDVSIKGNTSVEGKTTIKELEVNAEAFNIGQVENPEYMDAELDRENKVLAGRKSDGKKFENVGFDTPNISVDGVTVETVDDPEDRIDLNLDSEKKILSYRDKNGVLHENAGIITNSMTAEESIIGNLHAESINLSEEGMAEFENTLIEDGFGDKNKIVKFDLPKYGVVNLKQETFYLPSHEGFSSIDDVALIQMLDDTNENASNRLTLSYYYIKSTLTPLPGGGYDRTSVNENSIRLDFYAAGKVNKIGSQYYSIGDNPVEVTQVVDVPPYKAWPVDKNTEHYCIVDVNFGDYFSGNNLQIGVKYQGSSTTAYRKRNFRFTFYKNGKAKPYYPVDDDKFGKKDKIKIGEMVRLSGFNLKANWTDNSRCKEMVLYPILLDVWNQRPEYDRFPWNKEFGYYTGATGFIKGFPIRTYIGGTDDANFYGMHVFSLKKDEKNYMLDGDDDTSGLFVCGDSVASDCWNRPYGWEDEMMDEMSQSTNTAIERWFDFINDRLFEDADGNLYGGAVTINDAVYAMSTLGINQSESITAVETNDKAYADDNGNLYIDSEITKIGEGIDGILYVTSTLVDGQPTEDSVIVQYTNLNVYNGSNGQKYLRADITIRGGVNYVTDLVDWEVTNSSVIVTPIPYNLKNIPDRLDVQGFIDYFILMQVFIMWDNTQRNMVLHTRSDKKKFYPFFYDLDNSLNKGAYDSDVYEQTWGAISEMKVFRDMSFWTTFKDMFWDSMVNRYKELRTTVLTPKRMLLVYHALTDSIPDSDYTLESQKWSVSVTRSNFNSFFEKFNQRLNWLDNNYFLV